MQVAAPASPPISQDRRRTSPRAKGLPTGIALAVLLAIPLLVTIWGFSYYGSPIAERVRSPLHPLLRPSGIVGQGFGVAGLILFAAMWLYPLRKLLRHRVQIGPLGSWLRVHVVIGIALPLLVAVHAGWRFQGLIGLGYAAMCLVCLSGFVGRYLYVRIPRSRSGVAYTRDEVTAQRRALVTEIAAALREDPLEIERTLVRSDGTPEKGGALRHLMRLLLADVSRHRELQNLQRRWSTPRADGTSVDASAVRKAVRLAHQEIVLDQRLHMLEGTQKLLHYWHVAHRPFAITAFIAIVIHVVTAIAMGQTWLR